MNFILQPWQFFLIGLAGWINRKQQRTIEYLITENQVLREKVGNKRILLNDDQRRFYGELHDHLSLSTHGWISFLPQIESHPDNTAIPDSSDPSGLVAPYWDRPCF